MERRKEKVLISNQIPHQNKMVTMVSTSIVKILELKKTDSIFFFYLKFDRRSYVSGTYFFVLLIIVSHIFLNIFVETYKAIKTSMGEMKPIYFPYFS